MMRPYLIYLVLGGFCVLLLILDGLSTKTFNWPIFGVFFEVMLVVFIWQRFPVLKSIIGEGKLRNPWRYRIQVYLVVFILVALPVVLFIMKELLITPSGSFNTGILAFCLTMTGLSFAAASIPGVHIEKRREFVGIAQKFIIGLVLLFLYIPLISLIDNALNGININEVTWNSVKDFNSWLRGSYFWMAVLCFYGGMILLFMGIIDFIIAFKDYHIKFKNENRPILYRRIPRKR